MSCRRICRELVEMVRYGEIDTRSAPHLDHLAGCRACRDEVGFDRALVRQLRMALAERIEGASPSPATWLTILQRAQAPEGGLRGWLRAHAAPLSARLRTATAMAGMALVVSVAAGTQVAINYPEAQSVDAEIRDTAGDLFERGPLHARPRTDRVQRAVVAYVAPAVPRDPEAAFMGGATRTFSVSQGSPRQPSAEETGTTRPGVARSSGGPTLLDLLLGEPAPRPPEDERQTPAPPAGDPS